MENHTIKGCVITDPITGETISNNGIVFADDLTQIAMDNATLRTPIENLSRLTNITQLANNNLRASGGLFLYPKMQLSKPSIEPKGRPP